MYYPSQYLINCCQPYIKRVKMALGPSLFPLSPCLSHSAIRSSIYPVRMYYNHVLIRSYDTQCYSQLALTYRRNVDSYKCRTPHHNSSLVKPAVQTARDILKPVRASSIPRDALSAYTPLYLSISVLVAFVTYSSLSRSYYMVEFSYSILSSSNNSNSNK